MTDWNDAHRAGYSAREAADEARAAQSKANGKSDEPFSLIRLADVEPREVQWLWPGHLAPGAGIAFAPKGAKGATKGANS